MGHTDITSPPDAYGFDIGHWSRSVSHSTDAQRWFDRGLNWVYGFNHEEAVVCFQNTLTLDNDCAMAWWGIAYASGPFYNRHWAHFTDAEITSTLSNCVEAVHNAQLLSSLCGPADTALIEAIAVRYQAVDVLDRDLLNTWHKQYTQAMRDVYAMYPDDLDVATLFAEAAITCTPRQLWNLYTGEPEPQAYTEEVVEVLKRGLLRMDETGVVHPGILHMQLHTLEMSPFPERALAAADQLCGYAPDAGHLEHMPAHIYVICGDYAQAVEQSRRAVAANDKYVDYAGDDNFYSTSRCHDLHLFVYTRMFLGQFRGALNAADRMCAMATDKVIETSSPYVASTLDGYSAMRTHVFVRFGKWQRLATEPVPPRPGLTPIRFAMHCYGQGIGFANLGQFDQAKQAQARMRQAVDKLSNTMIFLNNPVVNMLAVGQAMLDGELAYHQGQFDAAFDALRLAVEYDDNLNYTEPWAWMHPPRHALGALLAEQGRYEEAENIFREDLGYRVSTQHTVPRCCSHPDNIWALQGLLECVQQTNDTGEVQLLRQRLEFAQARADTRITASCFCRTQFDEPIV